MPPRPPSSCRTTSIAAPSRRHPLPSRTDAPPDLRHPGGARRHRRRRRRRLLPRRSAVQGLQRGGAVRRGAIGRGSGGNRPAARRQRRRPRCPHMAHRGVQERRGARAQGGRVPLRGRAAAGRRHRQACARRRLPASGDVPGGPDDPGDGKAVRVAGLRRRRVVRGRRPQREAGRHARPCRARPRGVPVSGDVSAAAPGERRRARALDGRRASSRSSAPTCGRPPPPAASPCAKS